MVEKKNEENVGEKSKEAAMVEKQNQLVKREREN